VLLFLDGAAEIGVSDPRRILTLAGGRGLGGEHGRRARKLLRNHLVAWAAAMMTRVTAPGLEIRDRCPASILVM
jgi:hypothetical protein